MQASDHLKASAQQLEQAVIAHKTTLKDIQAQIDDLKRQQSEHEKNYKNTEIEIARLTQDISHIQEQARIVDSQIKAVA